jgi:voltage-gated potassium channel
MIIIILARKLAKRIAHTHFLLIFVGALAIVALGTLGGFLAENTVNPGFRTLGDSLWWTLVTMSTVGYGDIVPVTTAGKTIGTICMFGGPLLMVSLIGSVGADVYGRWTKGVKGMSQVKAKGHIVICGWNNKARDIVQELRAGELKERPITIVDDKIDSKPAEIGHVSFVRGNAAELHTLNKANIAAADFAVVLAEDNTAIADQRTVLTILAIQKTNPSIISCAELNDANNEEHLLRAGCSIIINSSMITSRLMAMSLQNPTVNKIIKELVSQEGNEIYRVAVPAGYIGRPFADILSEIKKSSGVVLIGFERNRESLINPSADRVLEAGDLLLVLSEETPVVR